MRKIIAVLCLAGILFQFSGCITLSIEDDRPPGHAKEDDHDARDVAPGHNK